MCVTGAVTSGDSGGTGVSQVHREARQEARRLHRESREGGHSQTCFFCSMSNIKTEDVCVCVCVCNAFATTVRMYSCEGA